MTKTVTTTSLPALNITHNNHHTSKTTQIPTLTVSRCSLLHSTSEYFSQTVRLKPRQKRSNALLVWQVLDRLAQAQKTPSASLPLSNNQDPSSTCLTQAIRLTLTHETLHPTSPHPEHIQSVTVQRHRLLPAHAQILHHHIWIFLHLCHFQLHLLLMNRAVNRAPQMSCSIKDPHLTTVFPPHSSLPFPVVVVLRNSYRTLADTFQTASFSQQPLTLQITGLHLLFLSVATQLSLHHTSQGGDLNSCRPLNVNRIPRASNPGVNKVL